jgi:hypothetical protein
MTPQRSAYSRWWWIQWLAVFMVVLALLTFGVCVQEWLAGGRKPGPNSQVSFPGIN